MVDSLSSVTSNELNLFADDCTLLCISPQHTSHAVHQRVIQDDIAQCIKWASRNGATFNPNKTIHMSFSRPSSSRDYNVEMCNVPIQKPAIYRHLGVQFTSSLDFSAHIQKITNVFRTRVILFAYMCGFLPPSALCILYKCFIRPTIEYAVPVCMSSLNAIQKSTLDKLQAKAARSYLFALGKPPHHLTTKENLNKICQWESVQWRRQILSLCYYHHVVHQFPQLLEEFQFRKSVSPRHPMTIRLPPASTCFSKFSLFCLSVEWNKLPEFLRSLSLGKAFDTQIKEHYASSKFTVNEIPNFVS